MDKRYEEGHVYDCSPTPLETKDYADVYIKNLAVEYLEQVSTEQPWFCTVGFGGPHDPWDTPKEYAERYKDMMPAKPRNAPYSLNANRPRGVYDEILNGSYDPGLTEDIRNMTPEDILELRRSYYGHITLIDEQIKHIIDCLKKRGMLEHTIIVFTADHGEENGDYGLLFKQTFLETSVRVPMMITIPSQAGRCIDIPVELMDLGATLCDLLGIDSKIGHSRSLVPVLTGNENGKEQVVSQLFGETMILERSFKAVFNQADEIYLLFNLEEDPRECINLASTPEAAEVEKQFFYSLIAWRNKQRWKIDGE